MPKFGMPVSKSKGVIGQGHTELMNVRDESYHGDTLTSQTKFDFVKGQQKLRPEHKAMS